MTTPAPPPPPPTPPPPPPPPAGTRFDVRWFYAGVVVVVILAVVASVVVDRIDFGRPRRPLADRPAREPAHHVVYRFATVGSANDDIEVSFTGSDGETEKLSLPNVVPAWRHELRTTRGLYALSLNVSARSSDLNFAIRCAVEIDGYVEEESEGPFCFIMVNFPRPSRDRPRARPPATGPPPTVPRAPAGCRLVSTSEVMAIVAQTAGGVVKPVLSVEGDERRCRYWIDAKQGYVEFAWAPGVRDPHLPGALPVRGLGGPAYWLGFGDSAGRLFVYLPRGELRVDVQFLVLRIDARGTAVRIARTARSRIR